MSRRASKKKRPRRLLRLAGVGFLLAVAGLGAWLVFEGAFIRARFEGRRWDVPARVYASPAELAVGSPLTGTQLSQLLEGLSYRRVEQVESPGTWSRHGARFVVSTRGFRFPDGDEPPRVVELRLAGGRLSKMTSKGEPLAVLRLEPQELGSLYRGSREDRLVLSPDQLPALLRQALVAVEDRRFEEHPGVDPAGIARALWGNVRAGTITQGGSTLTQQLVKNYFLDSRRTLWRKAREAVMSLALEAQYSKDEIFTAYANEVYLGQDGDRAIHGFGLASRFYFGRPLAELEPSQLALLVTLVRGASYYDPWRYPERAKTRRDLVLTILAEQGVLSKEESDAATKKPLGVLSRGAPGTGYHPAFLDLVRRQLARDYDPKALEVEGLTIFTTLEPTVQAQAEAALAGVLKDREGLQGAVVVTRPRTGEVVAVVGGRDVSFEGFDRALDAVRPIGSLIKPVLYLAAVESGRWHLASVVEDEPVEVPLGGGKSWRPSNADGRTSGKVPLFRALASSLNLPAVRVGLDVQPANVAQVLKRVGVEREVSTHPSMLLGSVSLTPFEVAGVYGVLASGGFRAPERAVRDVLDHAGQPLQRYELEIQRVAEPAAVAQVSSAMTHVFERGTAASAKSAFSEDFIAAGKTGTTDERRDSWFAGFTGDLLGVVWLGRDDNRPTGLTGASGALRVWTRLFSKVDTRPFDEPLPESVARVLVDWESGELVRQGCGDPVSLVVPADVDLPTKPGCGPGAPNVLQRAFDWVRSRFE